MRADRFAEVLDVLDTLSESKGLEDFEQHLQVLFSQVAMLLQKILTDISGSRFESLSDNLEIATRLQLLATKLGHGFQCSKCGEPALLRCSKTNKGMHGSFQFEHYDSDSGARTHHGGSLVVPHLMLVPMPKGDRRRRGSN